MEEWGAKTGESGSGPTFEVTVFAAPRSELAFGSPSKPQPQQMPLQSSEVLSCWSTTVCSEEVSGPSHRSQCGG